MKPISYHFNKNLLTIIATISLIVLIIALIFKPSFGSGPSVHLSSVKTPVTNVDSLVNVASKSKGVEKELIRLNYLLDSIDQSGPSSHTPLQELTSELEGVVKELEGNALVERRLLNELRTESSRLREKLALAEKSPWRWPSSGFLTALASLLTAITFFGVFVVLAFNAGGIWNTIRNTLREAERVELFGNTFILDLKQNRVEKKFLTSTANREKNYLMKKYMHIPLDKNLPIFTRNTFSQH
jgi:hypothetical protein